jgi:hypothetical protein
LPDAVAIPAQDYAGLQTLLFFAIMGLAGVSIIDMLMSLPSDNQDHRDDPPAY